MPILSVAGLNAEEKKQKYVKDLMSKSFQKKILVHVDIVPDPTNPFDSKAIKVVINTADVGYIAKVDQECFDFSKQQQYIAHIASWGILKDGSAYIYIQPVLKT